MRRTIRDRSSFEGDLFLSRLKRRRRRIGREELV